MILKLRIFRLTIWLFVRSFIQSFLIVKMQNQLILSAKRKKDSVRNSTFIWKYCKKYTKYGYHRTFKTETRLNSYNWILMTLLKISTVRHLNCIVVVFTKLSYQYQALPRTHIQLLSNTQLLPLGQQIRKAEVLLSYWAFLKIYRRIFVLYSPLYI